MSKPPPPCAKDDCEKPAVGVWVWKAVDMNIGVPYCDEHAALIKEYLATAGRMAGGTVLEDLRN